MVGSIGSMASGILSYNSSLFSSQQASTSQALNFEDMVSNGIISNPETDETSTGVTSAGGSSSSSGSNSEMDLNKDGQVTSDEVIKYMQMQMMDRMSEQTCSDDGCFEMGQQASKQAASGIEEFKSKQAASAYQSVQNSVIDMITDCFMV